MKYLFLALSLIGCSQEIASQVSPCPPMTPLQSEVKSEPEMKFDVFSSDSDVDAWGIGAEKLWQDATRGTIQFRHHAFGETLECKTNTFVLHHLPADEWTTFAASVNASSESFGLMHSLPGGCFDIWVMWPWPKEKEETFTSKFDELKVNPLVLVMAHEFGHALGLSEHADSEMRSLMVPTFEVLRVNHPTCFDVNTLGIAIDRSIPCRETF